MNLILLPITFVAIIINVIDWVLSEQELGILLVNISKIKTELEHILTYLLVDSYLKSIIIITSS
jgi:hypothetical protein